MVAWIHSWLSFSGIIVTIAAATVGFLLWRAARARRQREQPYHERQRQRRSFWGYE